MTPDEFLGAESAPKPQLPPLRLFKVTRTNAPDAMVSAHVPETADNGVLNFYEFTVVMTEEGYKPSNKLRRSFNKGRWEEMEEVDAPQPSSGQMLVN